MSVPSTKRPETASPIRIGCYICHCGINIAGKVQVEEVAQFAAGLKNVVIARDYKFMCSDPGQMMIEKDIQALGLNRVLVASCSPRLHEKTFQGVCRRSGLNPYLFQMASIREQVSWVTEDPVEATRKAKTLVAAAVSRLGSHEALISREVAVHPDVLVVGAGIAGMTAAIAIADNGFSVDLIEKEEELGGNLIWLHRTLEGHATAPLLDAMRSKVANHALIRISLEAEVVASSGHAGRFLTQIKHRDGTLKRVHHGVTILATGGVESPPPKTYQNHNRIVTQKRLEQMLADETFPASPPSDVVMIQCVGSMKEIDQCPNETSKQRERNYCSRVCCSSTLKLALSLKEQYPEIQIYVLYRHMMSYGFMETYYTRARSQGIHFIAYTLSRKPRIATTGDQLSVTAFDAIAGYELEIAADLIVTATGVESSMAPDLADLFGISLDEHGFFAPADTKWRPLDAIREGIFACGLLHSPCHITEAITMAQAAAERSLRILRRKEIKSSRTTAYVRHTLCGRCQQCILACPFQARTLDPVLNQIQIDPAACQGCGACAAVCPNSAAFLAGYTDLRMLNLIDTAIEDSDPPNMIQPVWASEDTP